MLDAKHARWEEMPRQDTGQRVKQKLVAGFDECNANVRCKEELVQKDTMRLSSGKQLETDGETDVED